MADTALSALFDGAQAPRSKKMCLVCGETLIPKQGRAKYCSRACSRVVENQRRLESRWESGVKRVGDIIQCMMCGIDIVFKGRRHAYCDRCFVKRGAIKSREWRERNPEKVKEIQSVAASKRKDDPNYIAWQTKYSREYTREKRKNPRHRLDHRISQLLRSSLSNKRGRAWESLVGYSVDELFSHIERQFSPGMSWENMSNWHVDHIRPRSMFEYDSPDHPDFKACWALTNLQPLWARDNIIKGAKRLYLI